MKEIKKLVYDLEGPDQDLKVRNISQSCQRYQTFRDIKDAQSKYARVVVIPGLHYICDQGSEPTEEKHLTNED